MRARIIAAAALALLPAVAAHAGETTTYTYDAKGRLTNVAHSGGPNDGANSAYKFDAADNRTSVALTGYHLPIVVVPLNGLTLIPLAGN